jgi:hypothetical protein
MGISYNPRTITDGLVLCLDAANPKSYAGIGTVWTDLSGRGNTGTLVNGVGYTGGLGGSLVFDGSNDGVQLPGTNLSLNQMTISSWNFSANYNQNGFMFEKTTDGSVNTQYSLFYENASGTATIQYRTYGLSTLNFNVNITTAGVRNGQWNNIVATFDGTNKKIYANGVLVATSANLTGTVTQNSTGAAYIGIYGNFGGYPFNGRISQTQIYNRALTASEIQQNYNALRERYNRRYYYERISGFVNNVAIYKNPDTDEYAVSIDGGNTLITPTSGGNPLFPFDGYEVIAAANVNGTNRFLWKNSDLNVIAVWDFDSNWVSTAFGPLIPIGSQTIPYEYNFNVDIDGDDIIPPAYTVIEDSGNTEVRFSFEGFFVGYYRVVSNNTIITPISGGNLISPFDGYEVIAAENINGTNQFLWKNLGLNQIAVWDFDSNWVRTVFGTVIPIGSETLPYEISFNVDINGDNQIG